MTERPELEVKSVSQRHGKRTVLEGASFQLGAGERLAVLGPSGSGKTTLLRILAGLDAPAGGEVLLAGKPASRAGGVLVAPEDRAVALVFQGLALFPHMSAAQQVAFAARSAKPATRAAELLGQVGLGERLDAFPQELSGGERQRLALARALAQEPRVLLLDEPFAELDPDRRAEMRDLLRALLDRTRTTLVLVTHAREDVLALAHRLVVLDAGRVVAAGELEGLVREPRRPEVVRALGLGSVVAGEVTGEGEAATPLGPARAALGARKGAVSLLVRPEQARVLGEEELGGVAGEVVSVALEAPEARHLRHTALVQLGPTLVRARAAAPVPRPGARVRVTLEGELTVLDA